MKIHQLHICKAIYNGRLGLYLVGTSPPQQSSPPRVPTIHKKQTNRQNVWLFEWKKHVYLVILLVTFSGWLCDPFKRRIVTSKYGIKRSRLESPGVWGLWTVVGNLWAPKYQHVETLLQTWTKSAPKRLLPRKPSIFTKMHLQQVALQAISHMYCIYYFYIYMHTYIYITYIYMYIYIDTHYCTPHWLPIIYKPMQLIFKPSQRWHKHVSQDFISVWTCCTWICEPLTFNTKPNTQRIHVVWYICLHLDDFYGKCRYPKAPGMS